MIVQRLTGVAFMVMGAVITYTSLGSVGAPPLGGDLGRLGLMAAAAVWLMIGIAMVAWPARVRTLTVPDWRRYERLPISGTSLMSYRLTGIVFVSVALVLIYGLMQQVQ